MSILQLHNGRNTGTQSLTCSFFRDPLISEIHLSEVKGTITARLRPTHFLGEVTGKGHLTQFDAVFSIKPDLTRRMREAQRKE